MRLTERDREILAWLGRHRFAMVTQVMAKFGMSQVMAYRRLGGMVGDGYLNHERRLHGVPGVYVPTKAGLAAADLDLPVASLDIRTYRHDLLLVWLAIDLEASNTNVFSEREMRHRESFAAVPAHFATRLSSRMGTGPVRLHFPDLVVERNGQRWAVELELTSKRSHRLEAILRSYAWARHLDGVIYYVNRPALGMRIKELAVNIRADEKVRVEVLKADGTEPAGAEQQ